MPTPFKDGSSTTEARLPVPPSPTTFGFEPARSNLKSVALKRFLFSSAVRGTVSEFCPQEDFPAGPGAPFGPCGPGLPLNYIYLMVYI